MRTDAIGTVEVKRETLYEEVWSEPLTLLGPRYGRSYVGLAKLCDRLLIPRPGVGHWTKLEHGKAPTRPPLPAVLGDIPEVVCLSIEPKYKVPIENVPVVAVGKRLTNPHHLVQKAAEAFAHSKPDRMHGLVSPDPGHLAIRVTPALERRASAGGKEGLPESWKERRVGESAAALCPCRKAVLKDGSFGGPEHR